MSEITPNLVYWITRLDYVRVGLGVLVALCVIAIIGLVIFAITTKITQCDEIDEVKRQFNRLDLERYWSNPPDKKISEDIKREVAKLNTFKDDENRAWRILRYVVVLFFSSIFGLVFIPTTKEMCAIIVIPKIANYEIVQKDIPKAAESMVKIAKNYLENLAGSKKEDEQ